MQLHRGQHPHGGRQTAGRWNIRERKFLSSGPEDWCEKGEVERTRWDERFVPQELADGYNPIGNYSDHKSGQDAESHARIANYKSFAASGGAANSAHANPDMALSQMSKLQKKQLDTDGDGVIEADELQAMGFSGAGAQAQDGPAAPSNGAAGSKASDEPTD